MDKARLEETLFTYIDETETSSDNPAVFCLEQLLFQLIRIFYANNNVNFAGWLPIHLRDMMLLDNTHRQLAAEFHIGEFVIHKSNLEFSALAIEQAQSCQKSQLATILETHFTPPDTEPGAGVIILDGSALINALPPMISKKFEEYAALEAVFCQFCSSLVAFGQGQNLRWIPIHDISTSIGLLFFHTLLADVISAFCALSAWQTWNVCPDASTVFIKLSQYPPTIDEGDHYILERFVVTLFDRSTHP
ncbi:unnamed protein product [Mytilus coruscus]|uniref:Uncharacterized protein n=1 Tax=Mytilus coruscus TaxID=42192 RepID=A0A6J8AC76_MYTCO|nr:unnamed protein product [Mytilus coruscus]